MKVFVTGSAGFIASSLIPKLISNGHIVNGVDSLVSGTKNHLTLSTGCNHLHFDINDTARLTSELRDIDLVIHLAAKGNVVESINNPLANYHSNVTSTLSLLEAMRVSGCKRLIFASTGGALMGNASPPVNESTLPKPISPYGASKLACEGYISAYTESYGFSSIILRFGNVYGPYSTHKVGVINRWIRSAIERKPIIIFGDGTSSRDYIHVSDLVDGISKSTERLSSFTTNTSETYHLANFKEITLIQLKNILSNCLLDADLDVVYKPARSGEVCRNFANIDLASSNLCFNPIVDFEEGISSLYQWVKINEYGC